MSEFKNNVVRSNRSKKRDSLNEIFSYFRWKSFIREMEKKSLRSSGETFSKISTRINK